MNVIHCNFQVTFNSMLLVACEFKYTCNILSTDFFNEECIEDAGEECSEFLVEVPLSEEFDSAEFDHFC